ncbi:5'-methylthioadenosine/adenosylhomocysteine nucleosidase [Aureisphaera galaxeae]|uniref:5'-methylthioadenosine/adenosylhomocysteine nucleosidase n=1 Tax=Aureisphaera galaxeae TaxID=1538023 RepID=UPI0023507168|nr:5'-methylthioadenosine/adenosylhomocysteine nucleosidase [Aureisphaera galaxeae]MDC8003064.1 5'-methylthioadenosine/adenosylhomocysteine nucleosidase [Aureisphaera galaxeae]
MKTGIMSAMLEEMESLLEVMDITSTQEKGNRTYYSGMLWGHEVVLVFSRWGKVASATTATHLIIEHKVDRILFSGVAGALDPRLNVGDIVIGTKLYQHDMDARPIFPQFEIPLVHTSYFETDEDLRNQLKSAAISFLESNTIDEATKETFKIHHPKIMEGAIASGDRFISDAKDAEHIKQLLPDLLCVEMEGAAVAQVCSDYNIPFALIRTISDAADDNATIDFQAFVKEVATVYTHGILISFLNA